MHSGPGLYFATDAAYSHVYATKGSKVPDSDMMPDESEMILVDLLLGDVVEMDRDMSQEMNHACRELRVPPAMAACELHAEQLQGKIDRCVAPPATMGGLRYNTGKNEPVAGTNHLSCPHLTPHGVLRQCNSTRKPTRILAACGARTRPALDRQCG